MIINNLSEDTKKLMKIEKTTQEDIAAKTGIARPNVSRTIQANKITDGWLKVLEAIGYDVKITYVKRAKSAEDILKEK